jgi:hypothetical protein
MKYIITGVACLLAVGAMAETSPQLDSIRVAAFNQIGLPTTGTTRVTAAKANAIINYAIQEISTNFPAVEKLDTVLIDSVSDGGALNTDFVAVKWCQLLIGDTLRVPLEYKPEDSLFTGDPTEGEEGAQLDDITDPRYYYTHANRLLTFPKFRTGDVGDSAFLLVGYFAVGDRVDAETDSTNIHPRFRDELLDWVCYRLEYMRYRYTSGNQYFAKYDKAKAEVGFKK